MLDVVAWPDHRTERPGHKISRIVEMDMRNHDRIDARPPFLFTEAWEHAGTAVQQDASGALDQVPRLCAPWVRPGWRAPDYREPHLLSVA